MSRRRLDPAGGVLALALVVKVAAAAPTPPGVVIAEAQLQTFGEDVEFVEIVNAGPLPVDVSGWTIAPYISDREDPRYGTWGVNPHAPYALPEGTVLAFGGAVALGNPPAVEVYGAGAFLGDGAGIPRNAIPNGAVTLALFDAAGELVDAVFVPDGRGVDTANVAGEPITPAYTAPAGAAGFRRDGTLLSWSEHQGTPGVCDLAPTTDALLAFLAAFRDGAADFDGDGVTSVNDLLGFLGAFRAGGGTEGKA